MRILFILLLMPLAVFAGEKELVEQFFSPDGIKNKKDFYAGDAYYQPEQFRVSVSAEDDGIYSWNSKLIDHHFCRNCGVTTFSDSPAFELGGAWDNKTRRIGVNARLFDNFDAASAPAFVIDGKNLW